MIDLDNLYGSWKYKRITREDITNAILKMNKNYEIEMQADQLKFQEKRIDDLEKKLLSQAEEVARQRKQIDGWIKRHLLDPRGKMT